jgi:hypothetical protein
MDIKTSGSSKAFNEAGYTQIKVAVPHKTAALFKARCAGAGVSMRSEMIRFMAGGESPKQITRPLTSRRKRREAVKDIIRRLECIIAAEAGYAERIPDNLKNSVVYEAAEETVSALEAALDILYEAYQ